MSAQECPFEFVERHKKAEKRRKRETERLEEELKAYVAERMDVSDVVRALRKERREEPEGYQTLRWSPYERCWSYYYEHVMYTEDYRRFDITQIAKELEKKIQPYFESYCKVMVNCSGSTDVCCGCLSGKLKADFGVILFLIKEEFDKFKARLEDKSCSSGSSSSE